MSAPIYGNYVVTRELGRGGMGAVYVAENQLGKKKAVKVLLPEWSRNPGIVKRFFAEAYAAARIDHPNIIEVEDLGQLPSGEYFLVMELLDGLALDDVIQRGPLPLKDILIIMVQVCAALAACHQHTIVHRDLKPANLFVVADHRHPHLFTKVLDFGIAKLADDTLGSHTQTGAVIGTPSYMAPEQARGLTDQIDARTDVYALGVILYELVTGRQPFQGGSLGAIAIEQLQMQLPDPRMTRPDLPARWVATIRDALAYQREARVQSARELAYRLIESTEGGWQIARDYTRDFGELDAREQAALRRSLDAAVSRPLWPPLAATSHPGREASAAIPRATMSSSSAEATIATSRPDAPGRRRAWRLAAAAVVTLGVVAAALIVVTRPDERTPAPRPAPAYADAAVAEPPVDAAGRVAIQIVTVPAGAAIAVDGVAKGTAPLEIELRSTVAKVSASLDGYETSEQAVDPARGDHTVTLVLRQRPATTSIEANKPTRVIENGPRKKQTTKRAPPVRRNGSGAANRPISPDDVGGD